MKITSFDDFESVSVVKKMNISHTPTKAIFYKSKVAVTKLNGFDPKSKSYGIDIITF